MNNSRTLICQLACTLGLALIAQGCREDLGCPPGTVMVGDVCEDALDMGVTSDASQDDGCVPTSFYADVDGDGLGAGEAVSACTAPEGYVDNADDCDDDCDVCGNGEEVCDGEDNDCDGDTDEDIMVVCGTDEGECSTGVQLCVGGVLGACEGGVMPALAEVCEGEKDENCDGEVDEDCDCTVGEERPCGTDVGECSFGTQTCTAAGVFGECEGAVGPTAELCNGLDDNCNGVDDDGNPGGGATCGSNVGACRTGVEMCVEGDVVCVGGVRPSDEVCNGEDDDCNDSIDEGVTTTFYRDQDGDQRGNPFNTLQACAMPAGYVAVAGDCDDTCNVCWSGNPETCDGFDNNCVNGIDEGVTTRFYADADQDGRGIASSFVDACSAPPNHVDNTGDCNDDCNVCWTGRQEDCDGLDNNCAGGIDETFTCSVGSAVPCTTTCGSAGTGVCTGTCMIPSASACVPPVESCNGADEDCDGLVDNGLLSFVSSATGTLGHAAKLASSADGYVGIVRYNSTARLYATNAAGVVTQAPATVDASNVVAVDIARVSNTQWVSASGMSNGQVNVRLLGLSNGVPTSQDAEIVNATGDGGMARVAANGAADAMTVFQSGTGIRVGHVDFVGALATSVALPGSNPRATLGMDIAAMPASAGGGYVVTWVTGLTPVVNVARVEAPGMEVSAAGALGSGSNPTVAVTTTGVVGVAYVGPDGRPRVHVLSSGLDCLGPMTPARSECAVITSARTVANPAGVGTFDSTLDLAASGQWFWLAARTTEGELLQRVSATVDATLTDDIYRAAAATSWITVAAGTEPLVVRGSGTAFTHHTAACTP